MFADSGFIYIYIYVDAIRLQFCESDVVRFYTRYISSIDKFKNIIPSLVIVIKRIYLCRFYLAHEILIFNI